MTLRRADPRSPEDLPAYDLRRAAQIVRLSPSTLRQWAVGDAAHPPVFTLARTAPPTLSFTNLTEAFVLASIRRVHGVSMQKLRPALHFVAQQLGYARPLVHARFRTDGVRLFVEHADRLLDASSAGQAALRELLDASLARIEWEGDFAARLYPWVRAANASAQPRTIVVDPRRAFGQPAIAGTGIEARVVAERYRAGESVAVLAADYHVELEKIEDAIRCESREAA